ncbi:WD repeat-containing protein 20-like [Paramacrobiotus metropolitanus]|uniref:WD repeat-containing protein 20-like n=1 Tax=Paramacrobiotus metropolitanus TaxID=2943436 RepID=UPI002445F753|nr:WD repeat-containing protein 20-like [Paramacrobiotus metropolitanus]
MSAPADGSLAGSQDIKQHFVTREGAYRNLVTHEYSRPRLQNSALSGAQQANVPVRMSLVQVADDQETGYPDRLLFNIGREIFLYAFKSIWEVPDLAHPLDRQIHKALPTCHDINRVSCSTQGCTVLIGFTTGSFHVTDPRKDPHIYNEDRMLDKTKVTCVKWIPGSLQQFLISFSSGQLFHCDDSLSWITAPPSYSLHKHGEGYAVYTTKSRSNRNPLYRWMIGEGSLNAFAFSPCNRYLATAGHDGYLRVFVFDTMDLLGIARSYFGGLLCLCWSPDSKFVCCAGEDDLVHIWSVEYRRIVARGRGHRSWVTAVSFDPLTSCLTQDVIAGLADAGKNTGGGGNRPAGDAVSQRITTYRFASVGQDTQICLWELTDDIVKQSVVSRLRTGSAVLPMAPVLNPPFPLVPEKPAKEHNHRRNIPLLGGRFGDKSSSSSHAHNKHSASAPSSVAAPSRSESRDEGAGGGKMLGSWQCPKLDDVPLLEPLVCKRIAQERLNDIVFHDDCILISTQEGLIMTWARPGRTPANHSSRQNSCSN